MSLNSRLEFQGLNSTLPPRHRPPPTALVASCSMDEVAIRWAPNASSRTSLMYSIEISRMVRRICSNDKAVGQKLGYSSETATMRTWFFAHRASYPRAGSDVFATFSSVVREN